MHTDVTCIVFNLFLFNACACKFIQDNLNCTEYWDKQLP